MASQASATISEIVLLLTLQAVEASKPFTRILLTMKILVHMQFLPKHRLMTPKNYLQSTFNAIAATCNSK